MKQKRDRWYLVGLRFMVLGLVMVGLWFGGRVAVNGVAEMVRDDEEITEEREPGAIIVDENSFSSEEVVSRLGEFLVMLEDDFSDEGMRILKIVFPYGKIREADVWVSGREEFYKVSLERGTAESAEDAGRMMRYLEGRELVVEYVDIRVSGKAFYR